MPSQGPGLFRKRGGEWEVLGCWGGGAGDLYCCPLVAQVWGDLAVLLSVVLMMQEWNMTSIRTVTEQTERDEIKHHAASYVWLGDVPYTQL